MASLRLPFIAGMKAMYHGEAAGPYKLEALVPGDCSGLPLAGLLDRLCRLSGERIQAGYSGEDRFHRRRRGYSGRDP